MPLSPAQIAWFMSHAALLAMVFGRALGLAWTAPALATPALGLRARIGLALLLGFLLEPVVEPIVGTRLNALPWPALGGVWLAELLIGAALGASAALIVAGARQAGELVGAQGGFAAAALFDPEVNEEMTALGHLYGLIALGVFLAFDGPLVLVRALAESYRVIPAGGGSMLNEPTIALAFGQVGQALALSVRAAAPPALALAMAGVALGLLGRAAPSLQLLALAMPIRAGLGLILLLLGLGTLAATLAAAWGAWPGSVLGGI